MKYLASSSRVKKGKVFGSLSAAQNWCARQMRKRARECGIMELK